MHTNAHAGTEAEFLVECPRRAGTPIMADSFAAGIYGSIVVAALVTALRDTHVSSIASAMSLLATVAVFWLAHVWSQITGQRIYEGTRFSPRLAAHIARAEWPLIEAGFGPAIVLLLGWAGVLSDRAALNGALAICAVQLAAWGYLVGRRAYKRWYYAALSAFVNFVLGLSLVALETSVLH
jgi:hypothetical protein